MKDSLNIAIIGATGYVGIQLIKILSKHSKAKIKYLCSRSYVGKKMNVFDKKIYDKNLPKLSKIEKIDWGKINILFTALPDGEAQKIASTMPQHVKLIDLSADFRLTNPNEYKKWYGINHKCKNLIKHSLYAVSEFSKKKIKNVKIIACPGCYPTSIQLPLVPLLAKKLINSKTIIIDSKSGYSGAGKKIKNKFKFKKIFESVSAYGVGHHRHSAEINQELSKVAKKKVNAIFTPHLIPMFRGILSTIYVETIGNIDAKKIYNYLKKYHKKNIFVKLAKFNTPIGTGAVMNTNFCNISICKSSVKNKVIIICTIDNLIKGASGQAVQNMNIAFNLNEATGLL